MYLCVAGIDVASFYYDFSIVVCYFFFNFIISLHRIWLLKIWQWRWTIFFKIGLNMLLICMYSSIVQKQRYQNNSNMTSFIGYINDTMLKLTIYCNSHKPIDERIAQFLTEFMYLYRTVVHTSITISVMFLPIFFSE